MAILPVCPILRFTSWHRRQRLEITLLPRVHASSLADRRGARACPLAAESCRASVATVTARSWSNAAPGHAHEF
jgi:hypothetical protein